MLFEVIDKRTGGAPIFDFNHIFREKWFKESNLIYCDISGWGIDEDGNLFLMDDCDNIAYPPRNRFKVLFNLRKAREINENDLISRKSLKKVLTEAFETVEILSFDDILSIIDNAETALFPLTVSITDKLTDENIEQIKQLMKAYNPQILNLEIEKEKTKVHILKIYPEYADEIIKGRKTFEVRYNDRDYKEGDLIQFTVISHEGKSLDGYSMSYRKYRIKYILDNFSGLKEGYIAFSIEEV